MTRQEAIEAKCKECIFDPLDEGTWRQQVQACEIKSCALYPYRPKPYGKPLDQAVQADSQAIGDLQCPRVRGAGLCALISPWGLNDE